MRPAKSAHLKLIEGNPGHRGVPIEHEPAPEGAIVKPKLKPGPSKVWDQYAPELIRLGLLTSLDIDLFAQWCELAWFLRRCKPEERTAAALAQLRVIGGAFGMGASERARIGLHLGKHAKRSGPTAAGTVGAASTSRYFKD